MNEHIATKLIRMMVHVLGSDPPSVPPRGVQLPSVLTFKKRNPKEEYRRYIKWRRQRGLHVWGHGCYNGWGGF